MKSLTALHGLLTVVMANSGMLEIIKMFQSFTIDFFSHSYVSPNVRIFSFVPSNYIHLVTGIIAVDHCI